MNRWRRIAQRWSGRGRLRTCVVLLALVLADWNLALQIPGAAVFLLGLLLHAIAKGHLVRNVELCVEGPYGWVRNPFYAANFLVDLGLCLLAGSPWLAAAYVLLFPLAYFPRVLAEEEALAERYPSAFAGYCARVPRWIPARLPALGAWLRGLSLENMIRENELSRLLRMASYPLVLAAYVILRHDGYTREEHWVFPLTLLSAALALWLVGEIVHRTVEDAQRLGIAGLLSRLKYAWLLLPLMPWLDDRIPLHAALEVENCDLALWLVGAFCVVSGMLSSWFFRARRNQFPFGLGLAASAFGLAVASEFVALAPVFALAVWLGWFFSDSRRTPGAAELEPAWETRSAFVLPGFCSALFALSLFTCEILLEVH